jgi:hypothetical protein
MKILDIARSQLGTHESPPNSNRVKYSAWYGMVGPWCDMFVSWCADQAGEREAVGRFAYTPSHEAWFRSKGREVRIRDAKPGDIVFFNFIGRTSHVGIVESNRGDGLITIEGNTNGGGSRDGGSVIRHFRSWRSGIVSVHRPTYKNQSTSSQEDISIVDANTKNYFEGKFLAIAGLFGKVFTKFQSQDERITKLQRGQRALAQELGLDPDEFEKDITTKTGLNEDADPGIDELIEALEPDKG